MSDLQINAVQHPIKSVTIFKSSKAEVVRVFNLELKSGSNRVEIKGLPTTIDTQSVRVSGLGDARLFDVVCTIRRDTEDETNPAEVIRLLKVKKHVLESERRVREHESELLIGYSKTLTGEHVKPDAMSEFLQNFVRQGQQNLEALANLQEKVVQLDRQIGAEERKLALKKGTSFGEATITIGVDEDATVDLKLTYIVSNASWEPTYELHAKAANGKPSTSVSLHYGARITQSTGEDWQTAALTLNTVSSDTMARAIPKLTTLRLKQRSPPSFGPNANKGIFGPRQFGPWSNTGATLFGAPQAQQQQQQNFAQQAQQQSQGVFAQLPSNSSAFGCGQIPLVPSLFANKSLSNEPQANTTTASVLPPLSGFAANSVPASGFGAFGSSIPVATQTSGGFGSNSGASVPPASSAFGASGFGGSGQGDFSFAGGGAPFGAAGGGLFGSATNVGGDRTAGQAAATVESSFSDGFEEIGVPAPFAEPMTVVSESPLAISYAVEGKCQIPSDGEAHKVSVAVLPFEGKVTYVSVPRLEPRVYLNCEVKNTTEYRLLPGPVSVIFDDSFVSKTFIQDINSGDTFNCTLGTDASTKISYVRTSKTVKDATGNFTESSNTTTYTTKISVHNKHQYAIPEIVIRDAIPLTDDKRVRVVLREPAGLADAKDGDTVDLKKGGLTVEWDKIVDGKGGEKEGKFIWKTKVDAGASVNMEARWEIKAPSDLNLFEMFDSAFT